MYKKYEILRDEKKLTNYQVSKLLNIPYSTLSDWKNSKYTPKLDKLKKIADYFGVDINYFLENNSSNNEKSGK